mgnify:FL=1|jgi:hypothetical protein
MYDIIFISYNEPEADANWKHLTETYFWAKRVHGVTGIHQAHIQGAKLANTEMVWFVDADAIVMDDFDFSYEPDKDNLDTVHVWRSQNPVNGLVYGNGGIKLFPRQLTIDMDLSQPDMTTSITHKFKVMHEIANITAFNTNPFSTWRSAFRECAKLSSKVIDRQKNEETDSRLDTWCTVGRENLFGDYAIRGSIAGRKYGATHQGDTAALRLVNNYDWLKEQFDADV